MKRLAIAALLPASLCLLGIQARAQVTSITATGFTGVLNGVAYTGTDTNFATFSNLAGTYTGFNDPAFSPPLPTSQSLGFISSNGFSITFASAVINPIFDIDTLVNTLNFGTAVTLLSNGGGAGSNQAALQLTANGQGIIGQSANNGLDAGGTVQLIGTFTSITATGTTAAADGAAFILVSATVPAAVPEPGSIALLVGMGVTGAGFLARRRK